MTRRIDEELRSWLVEALRQSGDRRSGISVKVEQLAANEVPELVVRFIGDGPPPPPTESIGFIVQLTAHRMSRTDARERLQDAYTYMARALGSAMLLPQAAEYEGVGELTEPHEDGDRNVLSASFRVFLGVEA